MAAKIILCSVETLAAYNTFVKPGYSDAEEKFRVRELNFSFYYFF